MGPGSAACAAVRDDSLRVIDEYVAYSRVACSLSELAITLTDDSAMAAAAMMGDSSRPKAG